MGLEIYRVEDTMVRIAKSYGVNIAESYVTPTAIIFTINTDFPSISRMKRIEKRGTDLNKIALLIVFQGTLVLVN